MPLLGCVGVGTRCQFHHLFEAFQSLGATCAVVLDIWRRMNIFCACCNIFFFADLIRNRRTLHVILLVQLHGANLTHLQDKTSAYPLHTLFRKYGRIFRSIFPQLYSLENHRYAIYRHGKDIKNLPPNPFPLLQLMTILLVLVFMLHFLQNCKRFGYQ
jgi:hypothetical protein